jgi:hypothetical protein
MKLTRGLKLDFNIFPDFAEQSKSETKLIG